MAPAVGAAASSEGGERAYWWRIIDGQVTQQGDRLGWLHPSHSAGQSGPLAPEALVMGLAPAADTGLHRAAFPDLAPRQAEAAARLLAAEQSIAPASALHVAMGAEREGDGSRTMAVVADAAMERWIGWAAGHGLDLASIVPSALLLPDSGPTPADTGNGPSREPMVRGIVAGEDIVRAGDYAFVADPALIEHIAGTEAAIRTVGAEDIEAAMIAACDAPPVELRSGRFARRPAAMFDAAFIRRAAMLVGAILLVSLLITVARIGRTYADIARLDAMARANVAKTLNPAPELEAAIPQLDARLAALGGGPARVTAPLAALLKAMDTSPAVSIDTLAWRGDGTLSVTLGAPRPEDINLVLIAIQAAGYTITAQPRAGTDGRALGDITIRSAS